ncbi:BirA family transcriptional regulator, biotin operon repressor / biotin---(acetyl-CoA-carboxylase) ligase [Alphaproteobacteria bacterium]
MLTNFTITKFDVISSTLAYARALIIERGCIPNASVIIAYQQTEGYGQYRRKWISTRGNIALTIALYPGVNTRPSITISQIPYLAAIAVGETVLALASTHTAIPPEIKINYKWVNDVLLSKRKVAGILVESFQGAILVGVGVNLISSPTLSDLGTFEKSNAHFYGATSLVAEGVDVEYDTFLILFLDHFEKHYNQWLQYGFAPIRNLWIKHAMYVNEQIRVKSSESVHEGIFIGLDENGAMLLQSTNEKKNVHSSRGDYENHQLEIGKHIKKIYSGEILNLSKLKE